MLMTLRLSCRRPALTALCVLMLVSDSVRAEGKSHSFVSIGAGATDLNGGLDWLPAGGPLGIGGELGVGWVFLASLSASYHPLNRSPAPFDPFLRVSFMEFSSSEFTARGPGIGGGATWWLKPWLGIRADAFRFLPGVVENNIPEDERSSSRYWGARAGVAFRFRR